MEPTASVPSWPCKNLLSWSLILTKLYKPLLPSSWGQNRVKRLARKNSEVKIIVFLHPSDNPEKWQSSISAAWRSNGWKWGTGKLTDIVPFKGTSNKKGKPVSSHCWSVTKFALKCVFKDPPEDIVKSPAGMSPHWWAQEVQTWRHLTHSWSVLRTRAQNSESKALSWAANLPTGKVCIQRLLLDVSFVGILEGAKGLISALWGVYPPGRTCSIDSALPTWNLPGALESRCGGSIMFSRTSAANHGVENKDKAQIHNEIRVKKTDESRLAKL